MSRYGTIIAAAAFTTGKYAASRACWFWFNQPKVPESMKKYINE
jgi:cyclic lactone autoinducer peptide